MLYQVSLRRGGRGPGRRLDGMRKYMWRSWKTGHHWTQNSWLELPVHAMTTVLPAPTILCIYHTGGGGTHVSVSYLATHDQYWCGPCHKVACLNHACFFLISYTLNPIIIGFGTFTIGHTPRIEAYCYDDETHAKKRCKEKIICLRGYMCNKLEHNYSKVSLMA